MAKSKLEPCLYCGSAGVFSSDFGRKYITCSNLRSCAWRGFNVPAEIWQARGEKIDPAVYAQFEASLKAEREKSEELLALCNEISIYNIMVYGTIEKAREKFAATKNPEGIGLFEKLIKTVQKYSQ